MKWKRIDAYVQRADSGHQVSASKAADGWRFSAWAPLENGRGDAPAHRLLGVFECAEDARAACVLDLDTRREAL
jgi:hypothetical protein